MPEYREFYQLAELLASFVVPNESGITEIEKIETASSTVGALCTKIKTDLIWWK
jgi:hypothetical protein